MNEEVIKYNAAEKHFINDSNSLSSLQTIFVEKESNKPDNGFYLIKQSVVNFEMNILNNWKWSNNNSTFLQRLPSSFDKKGISQSLETMAKSYDNNIGNDNVYYSATGV